MNKKNINMKNLKIEPELKFYKVLKNFDRDCLNFFCFLHTLSGMSRPFGTPVYQFGHPNSSPQITLFQFCFFSCISTKKYVEVAINDFTMHLIISKWLIRQKRRQKRKSMRQIRCQRERRNCLWKCFYLFKYVIDYENIHFFFLIFVQTCCKQ